MLRKALVIVAFATLACGSQDSSTSATGGSEETPPVSAVQPAAGGAQPTAETVSCLELVSVGKYAEAVVVCQTAASQDPTNTDVQAALAKAGAANAAQGAAGAASAAADSAVQGAEDAAAAVGDAASAAAGAANEAAANAAAATGEAIDSAADSAKSAVDSAAEKATP